MKKWINELKRACPKEEIQMTKKHIKKMVTIPGHKGSANQNHTKILSYSCQNGYHQEHHHQQMLMRMQMQKEPSYTPGRNVNYYNHYGKQYEVSSKN
jgi:hypothetical protein